MTRSPKREKIHRGTVWYVDLDPVHGHEQAGIRPCLVLSADIYNQTPFNLAVVVPITSTRRTYRWYIQVIPPEGGLSSTSYIISDQVRCVSTDRFTRLSGAVTHETLSLIEQNLKYLFDFES